MCIYFMARWYASYGLARAIKTRYEPQYSLYESLICQRVHWDVNLWDASTSTCHTHTVAHLSFLAPLQSDMCTNISILRHLQSPHRSVTLKRGIKQHCRVFQQTCSSTWNTYMQILNAYAFKKSWIFPCILIETWIQKCHI